MSIQCKGGLEEIILDQGVNMPSANWQEEYQAMLADCRQRFGDLDSWEQGFVESLSKQFDKPLFVPTEKQVEKLEAIWERVTAQIPHVSTNNRDLFGE